VNTAIVPLFIKGPFSHLPLPSPLHLTTTESTVPDASSPSDSPALTVSKPACGGSSGVAPELSFLNLASREVQHYIEAFADL